VPFYGVHVSIRDILTDFQAFTDLAMSILAPILDPILEPLQQLAQSIISQIPGLSQLLNLNITIPSIPDFASLFGNLTSLLTSLQSALQLFTLTCPPSANQPTFAAQIDDHMKDVAGYFGQGTSHAIQLGRGRHLTAAKGKIAISKEPIGRASLFRATLDVSKRVVLTAVSSRKILAIENGEFVLKKGPVTPASHLKIIPTGKGKFSLAARDEQPVEVGRTSAFSADRH
jgi:hypothetical protein